MKRRRGSATGGVIAGGVAMASLLSGAVGGATASALEPHTGTVSITVDSAAGTAAGADAGTTHYGAGLETLADAIAYVDAQSGGTITFDSSLSGDTISLTAALPYITQPTTISGPGASELTIDGGGHAGGLGSIFNVYSPSAAAEISGLTLTNGYDTGGGAIFDRYAPLTLTDDLLTDDSASAGLGGAVYARGAALTITDSTFSYDRALDSDGGAVDSNGGPLVITASTFSHDQAHDNAGAVYAYVSSATISGSTFTHDGATVSGGGAIEAGNDSGGTLKLEDSTLTGNTSGSGGATGGGALAVENLATTITDSTITGNSASGSGGGIWLTNFGEGSLMLQDSIVAGNTLTAGGEQDFYLANQLNASASFSLIGDPYVNPADASPFTTAGHNLVGTSASPLDPKLGPLADNGGPTETMLPQLDSPALDKGKAFGLTTDQRGDPRTVDLAFHNPSGGDGTDIGAVELQPSELPGRTLRGTLADRRVTMTLPSAYLCPKPSARLAVRFTSVPAAGSSSAKLRFKQAELLIGRGVKHVSTVTRRVKGHKRKVKLTTYLPNATFRAASGSAALKLTGLGDGAHTLKLAFVFTETEHRHRDHRKVTVHKTVTKAIRTTFTTC